MFNASFVRWVRRHSAGEPPSATRSVRHQSRCRRPKTSVVRWCLCVTVAISSTVAAEPETAGWIDDEPIELSGTIDRWESERIAAVQKALPSATSIFVPGGGGGGSGVVIDPEGFALTNFHVTSPAGEFMRCSLADGSMHDAVIVGIDPVGDLALIQLLSDQPFAAATLGTTRTLEAGDWSLVIGNPFLLAGDLTPTVTWGLISGVNRYQYPSGTLLEYGDCIQTDASINPGNSGGPIYNADAEVIGIVGRCSFEKRSRVNVGVGYAISIDQAKNFLGILRAGRIADHATLGATVATSPNGGVTVTNILEQSDAYRRGLRYDSEILRIAGRSVTTANDVLNVMATLPAHWRVPVTFVRDGETVQTLVRLRSVHAEDELIEKMKGAMPPPPPDGREKKPKRDPSDRPHGDGHLKKQDSRDSDPNDPSKPKPSLQDPSEDDGGPKDESESDDEGEFGDGAVAVEEGKLPAEVRRRYEARRGFANYHFNRMAQSRFIDALRGDAINSLEQKTSTDRDGSAANDAGNGVTEIGWDVRGKTDDGREVTIRVRRTAAALSVGDETQAGDSDDYDGWIDRNRTAAVLVALDAVGRMIDAGTEQFGETYAEGDAPLAGQMPLRHTTVSTDGGRMVRFFQHPDDGRLEAVEMFADRDGDPVEVFFERDATDEPPRRLSIRFGSEELLAFDVATWKRVRLDASETAVPDDPDATEDATP